jgi:hypothetical protein
MAYQPEFGRLVGNLKRSADPAQAKAQRLLERVYSCPVGHVVREIGAQLTLDALAEHYGVDAQEAAEAELARVLALGKQYFDKKHAEKVAAGVAL